MMVAYPLKLKTNNYYNDRWSTTRSTMKNLCQNQKVNRTADADGKNI
jgi:hypothetical protein